MKLNERKLVELSVWGEISSAVWGRTYRTGGDGISRVLPGTGGITYSHLIGDNAIDLQGDHVEPGVSVHNSDRGDLSALNTFSCVGNEARIISGSAKGAKGVVCGTHGGVEHVMIDLPMKTMEKLCIGDKVQIKAYGTGLEIGDVEDITAMNTDPRFLKKWGIKIKGGKLEVPVTHIIPAKIMGSGVGALSSYSGDYDLQMFDKKIVTKHRLNKLRFGDLVAITDSDSAYGRRYLEGAVTIGVIVHSTSNLSGHGPGVTTLLSSSTGMITLKVTQQANIGRILKIGRFRSSK